MESNFIKKIGTREDVFKCRASRTAGGLCKVDIIEKEFNGKLIYISKKISDKMKAQMSTNPMFNKHNNNSSSASNNSNSSSNNCSSSSNNNSSNSINNSSSNNSNIKNKKKNKNKKTLSNPLVSNNSNGNGNGNGNGNFLHNKNKAKTQKLSFEINKNEVKNVYYPELKGLDLKELKEELLREEAEEDNPCDDFDFDFDLKEVDDLKANRNGNGSGSGNVKKQIEPFKIEELVDIDINSL